MSSAAEGEMIVPTMSSAAAALFRGRLRRCRLPLRVVSSMTFLLKKSIDSRPICGVFSRRKWGADVTHTLDHDCAVVPWNV